MTNKKTEEVMTKKKTEEVKQKARIITDFEHAKVIEARIADENRRMKVGGNSTGLSFNPKNNWN